VVIGNVSYNQKSAYSRDAAMEKAARNALKHILGDIQNETLKVPEQQAVYFE
jgi:hypothetical protein